MKPREGWLGFVKTKTKAMMRQSQDRSPILPGSKAYGTVIHR